MERLTYNFPHPDGSPCWQVKGTDNKTCRVTCDEQGDAGCKGCPIAEAINRLADYEGTGLSPEEVKAKLRTLDKYHKVVDPLLRAEVSGLLVRLPCKVGDLLWTVKWTGNRRMAVQVAVTQMWFTDDMRLIVKAKNCKQGEIGGSFFLTREDAEEALRKE